ncbi:MAG TPA: hypothetical protein VEG63_02440 [Candidatus Acidoferrales bacterium]|nr:hypothetical protein [Candidatus Acidoferrales bacterium]
MESTKTSRGFLVAILCVVVVGLTALDIYQDRVIERQRFELRWLLTHAIIRADAAPADAAKPAPSASPSNAAKVPAADVAVVPQSSEPAAPAHTAKP